MLKVALVLTAALVASVSCNGEFSLLFSPDSVEFKGNENLDSTLVSDVVLSALGRSIETQENWNGLYIRNPFKLPRTAVVFMVDGVETIKSDAIKGHTYPVSGNEFHLQAMSERVPDSIYINLENTNEAVAVISETFGEIKPVAKKITTAGLKPSVNVEDKEFLNKLATIEALSEKLQSSEGNQDTPNLVLVRLSLAALREAHQETPVASAEAADLLAQQLGQFVDAAQKYFGDDILIATVATTEHISRHRRDTAAAAAATPRQEAEVAVNYAKEYNGNYPVIFNIILWFGVVMFFALLAICLAIGGMDPGRDSIIYRMTSTRIKKDN